MEKITNVSDIISNEETDLSDDEIEIEIPKVTKKSKKISFLTKLKSNKDVKEMSLLTLILLLSSLPYFKNVLSKISGLNDKYMIIIQTVFVVLLFFIFKKSFI